MRSIYEFSDPIEFMHVRKREMGLSFQNMADGVGIKAKSYFHKVLHRTKKYTREQVVPIATVLNITGKRQLEYFEVMTFLYRSGVTPIMREKILNKFRPYGTRKLERGKECSMLSV